MSAIHTVSRRRIDPCAPERDALCVEDIAHALSMICRAGGHFPQFYSVCQHSVACAREAAARGYSARLQLLCLLHDASEAYLADITRPVKAQLPQYGDYEARLQTLIYETFAGGAPTGDEQTKLSAVDDAMLRAEFLHFLDVDLIPGGETLRTAQAFSLQPFDEAEGEYIALYRKLG